MPEPPSRDHRESGRRELPPGVKLERVTRVTIRKEWKGRWLEFPVDGIHYRIPHDTLVEIVSEETPWLKSWSWTVNGLYHTPSPSKALLKRLQPFAF